MKKSIMVLVITVLSFAACKDKECVSDKKCNDVAPTEELCQAAFKSWFYDSKTKKCTEISYSGCNRYGFETKVECEKCDCNNEEKLGN